MGISAVDDLTTGRQDAARRSFFLGIALASTAANAALVSWAHHVAATNAHRLLDYSA